MRVIYVDDEQPALENFRWTVAKFSDVDSLHLFQRGEDALKWVKNHIVDIAFLDMEMAGIHGLDLATRIKECCPDTRIVFVTAYSEYALEAWNVDAIGYVLKPYGVEDIRKELDKCTYRPLPSEKQVNRIVIKTIPSLSIFVDNQPLFIRGEKTRELFALLVDRGEQGITSGEGIDCLWPDRVNDRNTQALLRMTYKRLVAALEEVGISHIVQSVSGHRYLQVEEVDCDLYRILSGDKEAGKCYDGRYLQEYSWAEYRNGQLYQMLMYKDGR